MNTGSINKVPTGHYASRAALKAKGVSAQTLTAAEKGGGIKGLVQPKDQNQILPQSAAKPAAGGDVMRGGLNKWPRQYAAEIIEIIKTDPQNREAQRRVYESAPEHVRGLVAAHVRVAKMQMAGGAA